VLAALIALLVRLWSLQLIQTKRYQARATGNTLRTLVVPAQRGLVLDRGGRPLVMNLATHDVVADPGVLRGRRGPLVLRRLARVLDVHPAVLRARLWRARVANPLTPAVLAADVPWPVAVYLAERRARLPGLQVARGERRAYPYRSLAAQVLGYTGPVPAERVAVYRRRGYLGNEQVGLGGVEAAQERFLRGRPGLARVEVDADGRPVGRRLIWRRAARLGLDVELSLDVPTQHALERSLAREMARVGSRAAAGAALDPRTGEVLALASRPTYRPAVFTRPRERAIRRLLHDPGRPLVDRAIAGGYPAGSTFKPIVATAALEQGLLGPSDVLPAPGRLSLYGRTFRGFGGRGHGSLDLVQALKVSSDTFFYQLGARFYETDRSGDHIGLQAWARRFGLGRLTGIDLPGEAAGVVPDRGWKARVLFPREREPVDRIWLPGDSVNMSIGQGYLQVTPLQMAVAYAAIANGGAVLTPTVASRVLDRRGRSVMDLRGRRRRLGARPETLAEVRRGLELAANGPGGTATAVFGRLPAADRVAGKTGTAENPGGPDHSWFVGYAPASAPRIVLAVVVEGGGLGANAAAPAVCRTMAAYLRFPPERCGQGASPN
jgi:penicillin-binding protein 2